MKLGFGVNETFWLTILWSSRTADAEESIFKKRLPPASLKETDRTFIMHRVGLFHKQKKPYSADWKKHYCWL